MELTSKGGMKLHLLHSGDVEGHPHPNPSICMLGAGGSSVVGCVTQQREGDRLFVAVMFRHCSCVVDTHDKAVVRL